jgi:hypothetical protein
MFHRPKVVKRCPQGHVMQLSWRRCPRCSGGRVPLVKARDDAEQTVFSAPAGASVEETRVGGASLARGTPVQAPAVPTLAATAGPLAGQEFPLRTGQTRIGKAPRGGSDVAVIAAPADRYMSKEHAALTLGSAALVLNDPGSTNGTFVNGSRVSRAVLKDGDELRMGETVFKVRLPG